MGMICVISRKKVPSSCIILSRELKGEILVPERPDKICSFVHLNISQIEWFSKLSLEKNMFKIFIFFCFCIDFLKSNHNFSTKLDILYSERPGLKHTKLRKKIYTQFYQFIVFWSYLINYKKGHLGPFFVELKRIQIVSNWWILWK